MHVWTVLFTPESVSNELYERGLALIDSDSKDRILRFYRREDAWHYTSPQHVHYEHYITCSIPPLGCLIGRLLPRALLKERKQVDLCDITFGYTDARKPYIAQPSRLEPPVAFNVSHDNELIAMAFADGVHHPPAFSLGIDVMQVRLPRQTTLGGFVESIGDTLTSLERSHIVGPGISLDVGLERVFLLWTVKEAYTKALGLGLGFDFHRIEYDIPSNRLTIDGVVPKGWEFVIFEVLHAQERYRGVVARYVGGELEVSIKFRTDDGAEVAIERRDAASLIRLLERD